MYDNGVDIMSVIGHWKAIAAAARRYPATGNRLRQEWHAEVLRLAVRVDELKAEAATNRGAVCLSDDEWDRVVWWLSKPVPLSPMKALDVEILQKIAAARGDQ